MSTIVCQNLVHCFESQHTETTTTLKLKVAAAPPSPPPAPPSEAKTYLEFGNWGCLQTGPNEESIEKEKKFYTHPFARKSLFSTLSSKSLELCTENLGSETGTDIITESSGAAVFFPPPSLQLPNSGGNSSPYKRVELEKPNQETKSPRTTLYEEDNSRRKIKSFPPPLTTISGSGGSSSLQVRRRTDGGRLIIEAVEAPVRSSCLTAERSGGRLRMCLLTGSDAAATTGEETENDEECVDETAAEEEIDEYMSEIDEPISEIESEKEEIDEEINLEMETEKIQRPSRCKERGHGNRGLCSDFKPALWVATS